MIGGDAYYAPEGLLRIPAFMPMNYCQRLCVAGRSGAAAPAGVVRGSRTHRDERIRKTSTILVPDDLIDAYVERLEGIREKLADKFGLRLGEMESPQVLAYGRGGHFSVHQDSGDDASYPSYIRKRVLSLVLFLNSPSPALHDGMYGGGTLTFFCLSPRVTAQECRVPVVGETGTLVVFPSQWYHCVTPVQHGMRWTLVTWIAGARQRSDKKSLATKAPLEMREPAGD